MFVFDGANAVAKGGTDALRAKRRAAAAPEAEVELDDDILDKATAASLRASFAITSDLVSAVINALRARGYVYYVAPFEADGQLAMLSKRGLVDAIFTVDSDLVVLGCAKVYLKINYYTGDATLIDHDVLASYTLQGVSGDGLRFVCA